MKRAWYVPLLASIAGCAGEQSVPSPPKTAALPSKPPPQPWPRLAEVRAWPPLNTVPFLSRGHLTTPSFASVRVSPNARDAYALLVTDTKLPDTALIALFHHDREGSEPGAIFVMEKQGERWRFLSLDRNGTPTGSTNACERCHASGVADSLFGLPRPQPARAPE